MWKMAFISPLSALLRNRSSLSRQAVGSLLDELYHPVCRCLKFCRDQKNFLEQLGCDRTLVEMMRAGNLYENAVQALAVQRATGLTVAGAKAPQGKDTEVSH